MSITDKFQRSWDITKSTFHVISQDKEILILPVLSSIFSIVLFLIFLFPVFFAGKALGMVVYLEIFLFYFAVTFAAVFFNAGVVHIAKTRFEGGDATLMDGLKAGVTHLGAIIKWSLISASVGLLLNILRSKSRRGVGGFISHLVINLIGLAWAIVTVFVVPAMVLKGYGPWEALKSSAQAIKKTWGESLIRHYGLGFVQFVIVMVGMLLFLLPAILMMLSGAMASALVLFGIFIIYVVLVGIIFSSANTVFNTALFMYADTGKVPSAYSHEVMQHAFKKK